MNALIPIHPQQVKGPFAVLDIGSSKLACLIIEQAADGSLTVLSHAMHASAGIQRGEISDLAEFSATLGKVVEAAERKASLTIKDLHIVMPGGRIASQIKPPSIRIGRFPRGGARYPPPINKAIPVTSARGARPHPNRRAWLYD